MVENIIIGILKKASDCYYNSDNYYDMSEDEMNCIVQNLHIPCQSGVTDSLYDEIYSRAKTLYPTNPFFLSVGSEVRGGKVKLPIPLGSMNEAKEGDMSKWMVNGKYTISAKLDGVSCLLAYVDGKLKIAYSRGDGFNGQDITRTVKQLMGVPNTLPTSFTGYIRGEIIIPKDNIQKCIDGLREETKKEYKNGRNLTAGQMNAEVANKSFIKYAQFVAYHIHDWKEETHKMFDTLGEMGFIRPFYMVSDNKTMTDDFLKELIIKLKDNYVFEIDGVICTMDKTDDEHEGFETSSLNPKNSRKVKLGLKEFGTKECEVIGITWQISKNYKLKPVINIKPIDLNGSTISNITGNNLDFILSNKICVGAKGKMAKMGDVIPGWLETTYTPMVCEYKKESVLMEIDDVLYKLFNLPLPNCLLDVDGVDLVLGEYNDEPNTPYYDDYQAYMSEAYKQQCVYFCSKLGIDFAGYGNIKALSQYIDNPYISYTNLCLLPKDVYENAIGINGVKMYESLHKQVENATPTQLADATGCFGEGIGEKKLQKIVDVYNDLPYDYDKVIKTEGWAEKSTEQYMNHYASWIEMTDFFIKNDMWNGFSKPITLSDKYKDVKVVFTGVRNAELEQSIRKNGGKVLTSFTKECNLVIAKDPMSSSGKLKKARENGVEIISLDDALNRFEKVEKEVVPLEKLDNPLVNMLKLN